MSRFTFARTLELEEEQRIGGEESLPPSAIVSDNKLDGDSRPASTFEDEPVEAGARVLPAAEDGVSASFSSLVVDCRQSVARARKAASCTWSS